VGRRGNVIERFGGAGVTADRVSFGREACTFNHPGSPSDLVDEFRSFYGPMMNAFDAAAKNGRADALRQ
jgi:hypothetical protein